MFEKSIMDPVHNFTFGCDYRVPVLHGLLNKEYVDSMKMDPSYNEDSFAREYLSIWSGANEESWFNFDKLSKYRKLKNPDTHEKCRVDANQFYLLSADVGRIHDSTVVCVFRVNINNEGRHRVSLVNLYVLGRTPQTKPFAVQALDLKKLIKAFNPREVVIDTNGLGFPQPKCATPKKVVCKTVFNCWDIPLGQSAAKFFPSFFYALLERKENVQRLSV